MFSTSHPLTALWVPCALLILCLADVACVETPSPTQQVAYNFRNVDPDDSDHSINTPAPQRARTDEKPVDEEERTTVYEKEAPSPAFCSDDVFDHSGFIAEDESVWHENQGYTYTGRFSEGDTESVLTVRIYNGYNNAPAGPGYTSLHGINYSDCGLCVTLRTGCTQEGCEKVFYADQGGLEIEKLGGVIGSFGAKFHGVVLREVVIDEDYVSHPVQEGEFWCLDGFSFEQIIQVDDLSTPDGINDIIGR